MNQTSPAIESKLSRVLRFAPRSLRSPVKRLPTHNLLQQTDPASLLLPVEQLWRSSKKIGAYSLLKTDFGKNRPIQIITHAQRFQAHQASFLQKKSLNAFTLSMLSEWLKSLQNTVTKSSHLDISAGSTFLLEELVLRKNHNFNSNIGSTILSQIALENFSRIDSRVVAVSDFKSNEYKFMLLVKKAAGEYFFFCPESGKEETSQTVNGFFHAVNITAQSTVFGKDRKVTLFNTTGKEIIFQVTGRTPAENRFAKEAALIATASDEELVPYELLFHPFWRRYGHTTLRIGDSLYEFSSKGWVAHNTGADSARAYIFNNPFFKSRYAVFSPSGMPPISYAVSRLAKASTIREMQKILDAKCAYQGKGREKFNLFLNNCNQKLREVFRQMGLQGYEQRGYVDFSSVLCFNHLLNSDQTQNYFIYPLPNTEITESTLRNWMPRILYLENSPRQELHRAARSVLKDVYVGVAVLLNKLTIKLLGTKIWHGHDDYQHINDQWL